MRHPTAPAFPPAAHEMPRRSRVSDFLLLAFAGGHLHYADDRRLPGAR